MGKKQIVLQSNIPHRFTANFRDEKGVIAVPARTVTVPSKDEAPKNILILSPDDFESVRKDLQPYLDLGRNKGIVELDGIPSGFWDPQQRVAEAEGKRLAAEAERDGAVARAEKAETEAVRLREILVKEYKWTGK